MGFQNESQSSGGSTDFSRDFLDSALVTWDDWKTAPAHFVQSE
jgi:hypothetical protein